MAISIQAIQCPKCGSTEKTEVKPDHYRCSSCGTEYFLDNDNAGRTPASSPPLIPGQVSKRTKLIFGASALVVVVFFLISRLGQSSPDSSQSSSAATNDNTGASQSEAGSRRVDDASEYKDSYLFQAKNGNPVLLVLGDKVSHRGSGDQVESVMFVDMAQDIKLNSCPIPGATYNSENFYAIQEFSNGDLYIVINHTTLYQIDRASYTIRDVSKKLFEGQPGLAGGISQVDFIDEVEDGFKLGTNDGKTLFYFPIVNKIYTQDSLYRAQTGFESLLPGSVEKTSFVFAYKSTDEENIIKQLETYRYMYNKGGPTLEPTFDWRPEDSLQKNLIRKESERVVSYAELTPGRVYFQEKLLYYDNDYVLIRFTPTKAPTAISSLQCLNARTGAVVFTLQEPGTGNLRKGLRYKDEFVVSDITDTYIVSMKGDLIKTIGYNVYGF